MDFITDMWWLWLIGIVAAFGWELIAMWRFAVTDDNETAWFGIMAMGHFLIVAFGAVLIVSIIGNVILWMKGLGYG